MTEEPLWHYHPLMAHLSPAVSQGSWEFGCPLTSVPPPAPLRFLEDLAVYNTFERWCCYLIKLFFKSDCSLAFWIFSVDPAQSGFYRFGLFDKPLQVQSSVKAQTWKHKELQSNSTLRESFYFQYWITLKVCESGIEKMQQLLTHNTSSAPRQHHTCFWWLTCPNNLKWLLNIFSLVCWSCTFWTWAGTICSFFYHMYVLFLT